MKVLINGLLLSQTKTGIGYTIENLMSKIGESYCGLELVVLVPCDYNGILESLPYLKLHKVNFKGNDRLKRIFFENSALPKYYHQNGFRLYHSMAYILPMSRMNSLLTIHDLIAIDYPNLCQVESAVYFNLALPGSVRRARKIIAVSETVKKDIIRKYGISEELIDVIYPVISEKFRRVVDTVALRKVQTKYNLPAKFVFFVGCIEPKKNLKRLISAFFSLRGEGSIASKLVIAGKRGWKCNDVFQSISDSPFYEDVIFLGYVDEDDLPALYSLCELFVFPSLYEGFGMPVLEAMSCRAPVLISNSGALPEVARGIFPMADPFQETHIADCMRSLLGDENLRAQNIKVGMLNVDRFMLEESVRKTIDLYKRGVLRD